MSKMEHNTDQNSDFSAGKIFPIILKFSIPAALSLLITAVYNIVTLGCVFQGLTLLMCDFVRVSGKPVLGFVMLATTFFQSIGKPMASSVITLIRQVLALVPFIYILPVFLGTMGIFWAQPLSDLLAGLSVILMVSEFKKLPSLFKAEN